MASSLTVNRPDEAALDQIVKQFVELRFALRRIDVIFQEQRLL